MTSSTRSDRGDARGAAALAALLALIVTALAAGRAAAAEPAAPGGAAIEAPADAEARRLYEEGLARYKAGAYDEAIEKLRASYARVPAPGLLYNLAQAHRLKGDCAGALAYYRAYLDSPGTEVARPLAEARAAEMESCAAPSAAARAAAPGGDAAPAAAAAPSSAALLPRATGAPTPPGILDARAAPVERPHPRHRRVLWAGAITTTVLAAATGYFAWRTAEMSDRVAGTFVPGSTWNGAGMDAQGSGQQSEKLEIAAGAGALVAGGITAWLWLRDR
jgi:hypothetical protein